MPATAGRVRMPANNRMHSSAALQTHGIWSNTIGYDPYAPENKDVSKGEGATELGNAYDNYQGLLALARLTGSNADEQRGSCKKCGRVGHLTFQCKNFLSSKESIAVEAGSVPNASQPEERSDMDTSDEDDDLDDDSSEDSEMERVIREMKNGSRMEGLRSRSRKDDGSLRKDEKKRRSRSVSPGHHHSRSSGSHKYARKSKGRSSRKRKHRRYGSSSSDDSSDEASDVDEDDHEHHQHLSHYSESHCHKKHSSQARRVKGKSLEDGRERSKRRRGCHTGRHGHSNDDESSDSHLRVKRRAKEEHDRRRQGKGMQAEDESNEEALTRDRKASSSKDEGRAHKRSKRRHGGVDGERSRLSGDEAEGENAGRSQEWSKRRHREKHSDDEVQGEKQHLRSQKKQGSKERKRTWKRSESSSSEEESTVDEHERGKSSKQKKRERRRGRRRRSSSSSSSSESGQSISSDDERVKHAERKKATKASGKEPRTKDKPEGGLRNVDRPARSSKQVSDSDISGRELKKGSKC